MLRVASLLYPIFCYLLVDLSPAVAESFSEELLLRPLPDGNILAHFHFLNKLQASNEDSNRFFPEAIYQLVQEFSLRELELSFTHGRWDYQQWGFSGGVGPTVAKPGGAELWAWFDLPLGKVDAAWAALTNALSGLFCASLNLLEEPRQQVVPLLLPHPDLPANHSPRGTVGPVRYGALPREAVCTENLTPWLKLLPCGDMQGVATLLDRPAIYRAQYHALRTHLRADQDSLLLEQTLTLTMAPDGVRRQGGLVEWSLSGLFGGRGLQAACPAAGVTKVYVEFPAAVHRPGLISPPPRKVLASQRKVEVLEYDVPSQVPLLDIHVTPAEAPLGAVTWPPSGAPFEARRFLSGHSYEHGGMQLHLHRNSSLASKAAEGAVEVLLFQAVPWYVRLYLHTLTVELDERQVALSELVEVARTTPAEDRQSLGVLELQLRLPGNVSHVLLAMHFDKGYLYVDEHPPDASRGFDLPASLLLFPGPPNQAQGEQRGEGQEQPLLHLMEAALPVRVYSERLLVPLAHPDFSMPYNVTTLTCTAVALIWGSLFNTLLHDFDEDEAKPQDSDGRRRRSTLRHSVMGIRTLVGLPRPMARALLRFGCH